MRLELHGLSQRRKVTLRLIDAGLRPVMLSGRGEQYRPDMLELSYLDTGGSWRFTTARLSGWRVRPDGTPTVQRAREDARPDAAGEVHPPELAAWLAGLIADYLPQNSASWIGLGDT